MTSTVTPISTQSVISSKGTTILVRQDTPLIKPGWLFLAVSSQGWKWLQNDLFHSLTRCWGGWYTCNYQDPPPCPSWGWVQWLCKPVNRKLPQLPLHFKGTPTVTPDTLLSTFGCILCGLMDLCVSQSVKCSLLQSPFPVGTALFPKTLLGGSETWVAWGQVWSMKKALSTSASSKSFVPRSNRPTFSSSLPFLLTETGLVDLPC